MDPIEVLIECVTEGPSIAVKNIPATHFYSAGKYLVIA